MPRRTAEIIIRNERRPVPPAAFTKWLESLPNQDRRIINEMANSLDQEIKGIGYVSALEILWSLGRLFNQEIGSKVREQIEFDVI